MRPATTRGAALLWALVPGAALLLASGCLGGPSNTGNCTPSSYEAFQSYTATNAIPLCTDATEGSPATIPFDAGTFQAASYASLPGSSPLSPTGLTQCAAICAGAVEPVPCCKSQWEPQTVVCPTPCP